MFKDFFKTLFGKRISSNDTRKIGDSCNYWAEKDKVKYSPSFTVQDVLSSTAKDNDSTSKIQSKNDGKNSFSGSSGCIGGCGGGCIGGCGGGCI